MPEILFTLDNQQGAIPAQFQIALSGDYIVLTGENNAGKSSLLQSLFKRCASHGYPVPFAQVSLLLPDRMFVDVSTNTGRRHADYNRELVNSMVDGNNRSYQIPNNSPFSMVVPKVKTV